MRIIGGTAAGRILAVPEGLGVRPTQDKVKQALFNSLGNRVHGARILDLFAGSGALGLESLSRGAVGIVSIELSPKHAQYYKQNLKSTQLDVRAVDLRVLDVFKALGRLSVDAETFDLIVADPPYGDKNVGRRSTSFAQRLLDDVLLPSLLKPGGLFVLGHTKRDSLDLPKVWHENKLLKHGDTLMRILSVDAEILTHLATS